MKNFLYIFSLIAFMSVQVSFAQTVRSTTFDNREICEKSKGMWREFGNGCADSCRAKLDRFTMCTMSITYGCDCGENRCWENNKCVNMKDYQKVFDVDQAKEKEELDKIKEARKEEFQRNSSYIINKLAAAKTNPEANANTTPNATPTISNSNFNPNPNSSSSSSLNDANSQKTFGTNPLANFIVSDNESNKKALDKMVDKIEEKTPVKQKFEIPSFFSKRQEMEKKTAEQDVPQTQAEDENSGITLVPFNSGDTDELPQIALPN